MARLCFIGNFFEFIHGGGFGEGFSHTLRGVDWCIVNLLDWENCSML